MRPTVLFLAANPTDTSLLALDDEVAQIEAAIGGTRSFDWYTERAVRRDQVRQLLARQRPVILHFSGHGATDGLMLLDEHGRSSPLQGEALRRLCDAAGAVTRLAVLNACHTDEHARALSADVDCVVGTSARIRDDVARAFSKTLYRGLAAGQSVRVAFDAARQALRETDGTNGKTRDIPAMPASLSGEADHFTLHVRPGINAEHVVIGAPEVTPAEVPPGLDVAELLIAREHELNALDDACHGPAGIIALWGLPGVGKSALARAHAWRQIETGRAVAWISGRADRGRLGSIAEAVAGGATLYCDDVEPGSALDALRELAALGRVVITTRDEVFASENIAVPVAPLEHADAVQLLLERTGQHDAESAGRIAHQVGELPLALVQVAALVAETSQTLHAVCQQLESPSAGVLDTRAFDLIYDRLAERPATRTLLQALGCFALERVPRALIPAFASAMLGTDVDEHALHGLLAALRRYSLIAITGEAISIPRAVQQLVVNRVTPVERSILSRKALELAWAQVADRQHLGSAEAQDLAAQVIRAIDPDVIAPEGTEDRVYVARMFASASFRLGRFIDDKRQDPQRALFLFRQSAREQERFGCVNGMRDFNLALRHVGWTAARTGDPGWLSSCERAIAVARQHLTPGQLASTLNDAAASADAVRDHERAVELYREVLEHAPEEDRGTLRHADTLDNLGKVEHSLSHDAKGLRARDLLDAAIRHTWAAMDIRIRSGNAAQKAHGAHNLADVLICKRGIDAYRARAGLALLRCAHSVWRTTMPAWSDELASTTASIASVSDFLGEPSIALDDVNRLIDARRAYLPRLLTNYTFKLARIKRDESARRRDWNDLADAVFLMLDIHPCLKPPDGESIDELHAWLGIAAERGAVDDTEYATRVGANPSPAVREHEARLRQQFGIPQRRA